MPYGVRPYKYKKKKSQETGIGFSNSSSIWRTLRDQQNYRSQGIETETSSEEAVALAAAEWCLRPPRVLPGSTMKDMERRLTKACCGRTGHDCDVDETRGACRGMTNPMTMTTRISCSRWTTAPSPDAAECGWKMPWASASFGSPRVFHRDCWRCRRWWWNSHSGWLPLDWTAVVDARYMRQRCYKMRDTGCFGASLALLPREKDPSSSSSSSGAEDPHAMFDHLLPLDGRQQRLLRSAENLCDASSWRVDTLPTLLPVTSLRKFQKKKVLKQKN